MELHKTAAVIDVNLNHEEGEFIYITYKNPVRSS
jgi:hypothetical protein